MPNNAEPAEAPKPASENPKVVEQQIEEIKQGEHKFTVASGAARFIPDTGLPVLIDYRQPRDPFELSAPVKYESGPLKVIMPAGFKCDASSTPRVVWWSPTLILLLLGLWWWMGWSEIAIAAMWAASLLLSAFLPVVMPGVGQLGLHARAVFLHDALYRTQVVSRVVADAVLMEVMEYDRVRALTRWLIYLLVRMFGGRIWKRNAADIAEKAKAEAAAADKGVDPPEAARVEPISEVAPVAAEITEEKKP